MRELPAIPAWLTWSLRRRVQSLRLRLLASPRYWSVLRLWDRMRFTVERRRYAFGSTTVEVRRNFGVVALILRGALRSALLAIAFVIALELAARAIDAAWTNWSQPAARPAEAGVTPLLLAVAALGATLLGLYFTAQSVIVSTGYARVSWRVRALVLQEPASAVYSQLLGLVVASALLLLALSFVGYEPPALTLVALCLLAASGILALLFLGPRAFRLYDPAALAGAVLGEFEAWSRRAADGRQGASFEHFYQRQAAIALDTCRQLVVLATEARAPDQVRALHGALCRLWLEYSAVKPRIRADSRWFARDLVSASWLRTDDDQITLALATGTPLRPTERINRLWVEEQVAETLGLSLEASVQQGLGGEAYPLATSMAELARGLASGLDVDAALLVLKGLAHATASSTTAPVTVGSMSPAAASARRSILDAQGLGVVQLVLGVRDAAHLLVSEPTSQIDAALGEGRAKAGSPVAGVLDSVELLRSGLALEQRIEGGRRTPDWWLHQMVARRLFGTLDRSLDEAIRAIESSVVAPAETTTEAAEAALLASRAVEAVNKAVSHLPAIEAALARLSDLRNAKDDYWPARKSANATDKLELLHDRALGVFARSVDLLADSSDEALPDLFGQALFVLGEACFEALLSENPGRFEALFPAVHRAAFRASTRAVPIAAQLEVDPQLQAVIITNPLVDLLELSGYALISSELEPGVSRAWTACQGVWDSHFARVSDSAGVAAALAGTLDIHDMFAILPGDILRTSRGQRYQAYMAQKLGLGDSLFDRHRVRHASPIVEVAVEVLGPKAASIFVVQYVAPRLDPGTALPRKTRYVAEALGRRTEEDDADTHEDEGDLP